jgi:hypothetical protein
MPANMARRMIVGTTTQETETKREVLVGVYCGGARVGPKFPLESLQRHEFFELLNPEWEEIYGTSPGFDCGDLRHWL